MPPPKTGWPSWNVVISHLWCTWSCTIQNSDKPASYWSHSRANLGEHRISAYSVAEQLGLSRERVGPIINEILDMRNLSANWVPKCLNTDQNHLRFQSSVLILEFFGAIQMISCPDFWPWTKRSYITVTLIQDNNQCSCGIAAHPAPPRKIPNQISTGKFLASNF